MANEAEYVDGTTLTIEPAASSAAVTPGTFTALTTALPAATDAGFPFLRFIIKGVYGGTAPTAGEPLNIYAQEISLDGTSSTPPPSAAYPHKLLASVPQDATATQTTVMDGVRRPSNGAMNFYLENGLSAGTLSSSWSMLLVPYTYVPGA